MDTDITWTEDWQRAFPVVVVPIIVWPEAEPLTDWTRETRR